MERIFGQLGSNLEVPEQPKSMPKLEKMNVERRHVFGIDFSMVRTLFWKGFR